MLSAAKHLAADLSLWGGVTIGASVRRFPFAALRASAHCAQG